MFWLRFVRYNFPLRVLSIWPLLLSALALGIFIYNSEQFYRSALYEFCGSQTVGWYSDFQADCPPHGQCFLYAYRAGGVTYGGRGLYENADNSDIYFKNVGSPVGVGYLTKRPWVSTLEPGDFKFDCVATTALTVLFVWGIRLSVTWRPGKIPN
jgi:hypothetical protein